MPSTPRVSVIVPVYNDPEGVTDTLRSLYVQTYGDYEILPVDNGSTDGGATHEAITRMAMLSSRVRPLSETDIQGSYAARNKGIENARGDLLFFIDADVTVEKTWIEDAVASMDRTGALYAGCNIEFTDRERALKTVPGRWELAFGFAQEWYLNESHFAVTAGLLTRREAFDRVGLFDSRLLSGGDGEFGQRVHAAGIEQYYLDDVTVYHPPRTSFSEHWSRSIRIGRGLETRHHRSGHDSGYSLTTAAAYLPNAKPWKARDFLGEHRGKRDTSDWPLSTVLGLYLFIYFTKLGTTVGRISAVRDSAG